MKIAGFLAAIFLVFYIVITVLVPPILDQKLNGVTTPPPYTFSPEAVAVYNELPFIADLHCDALLWKRPMDIKLDRSHVDLPKMLETRVSLQVFTVVSKSPAGLNFDENADNSDQITALSIVQGRPLSSWFNLKLRVGAQSRHLHRLEKKAPGRFKVIHNRRDLEALIAANRDGYTTSGGLFGLEGAHPLKGRLKNVDYIYEKGTRMVGLVHFFDNEVGGSAHGVEKDGLTEFGRKLIGELEARRIIIDLAHASDQLMEEVLALARRPVVVSHTGVKGVCDRGRNLTDEQIRGVAATGGLIGIAFFEETMCGLDPALIARGIQYVRDLVGIEYVALGSDFDGSVTTPFDMTGLPIIVEELLALDFTYDEIARVMGVNVRDFLLKNLPA